jgi:hypothetical protein
MITKPQLVRMLPGKVEQREPWPSEVKFFRKHPHVEGMAAEDGRAVLNPFSKLTEVQKAAVALNEAARIFMERKRLVPSFGLTRAQADAFAAYGPITAQRATIAGRLLSRDPSALAPTSEQLAFVRNLAQKMGIS